MRKTRKGNDTQQKKQERIPDPEAGSCNPESSARIEKDLEDSDPGSRDRQSKKDNRKGKQATGI
jgi:hypothetical protein